MWAHSSRPRKGIGGGSTVSTSFMYVRREIIDGSPLETVFETVTNPDGSFALEAVGPESWLGSASPRLTAKRCGSRPSTTPRTGSPQCWPNRDSLRRLPTNACGLWPFPPHGSRVAWSPKCLACAVADFTVSYQGSRVPGGGNHMANLGAQDIPVGHDGRFRDRRTERGNDQCVRSWRGRGEGLDLPRRPTTSLTFGETSEVVLEPIRGVAVEGTVVVQGTGAPIVDAGVGVYGPYRPRTGRDDPASQDRCPGPLSLPAASRYNVFLCHGFSSRFHATAWPGLRTDCQDPQWRRSF